MTATALDAAGGVRDRLVDAVGDDDLLVYERSPVAVFRLIAGAMALGAVALLSSNLAEQARFVLTKRPLALDEKSQSLMKDDFKQRLVRLRDRLANEPAWDHVSLGSALKAFATEEGVGLGQIGPGLRAALTGGTPSPDLGQTLELLGRDEALARISDQV